MNDARENQKAVERLIPGVVAMTVGAVNDAAEKLRLARERCTWPIGWTVTTMLGSSHWFSSAIDRKNWMVAKWPERMNFEVLAEAETKDKAEALCKSKAWAKHRKNTGSERKAE